MLTNHSQKPPGDVQHTGDIVDDAIDIGLASKQLWILIKQISTTTRQRRQTMLREYNQMHTYNSQLWFRSLVYLLFYYLVNKRRDDVLKHDIGSF